MEGEKVKEQGLGSLLQWNAFIIALALFVTLFILEGITTVNDWTNIGILLLLVVIAMALLITSADFFVEAEQKVLLVGLEWLRLLLV